jgi:GNAT superfamily N-acetyltransferase
VTFSVRRVRAEEWERVRELRLEAVRDPAASIAFLYTYEQESAHPDSFWQERTDRASDGDAAAQFIAESGDQWIGSLSVLRTDASSGNITGVYVRAEHRGRGVIDALFEAAADWARSLGDDRLTLDVHTDNERAQGAYRRLGFEASGHRFTGPIGPELQMARALGGHDDVSGDSGQVDSGRVQS